MFSMAVCTDCSRFVSASKSSRMLSIARWKSCGRLSCSRPGCGNAASCASIWLLCRARDSGRFLPQLLDLLLELDHPELAAHGQLLESLELGQPLQFLGALVGDLRLGLL